MKEYRKCKKCGLDKWREDFPTAGGLTCKACNLRSLKGKTWYKQTYHKEEHREYIRDYYHRRKAVYGMPLRMAAKIGLIS